MPLKPQNRRSQTHCGRNQAVACAQCTRYTVAHACVEGILSTLAEWSSTALLHTRSRVRKGHSHARDILVGTFMDDDDDRCKQRFTDGGTGGRVLSFSHAETARPTVNGGVGRPSIGVKGARATAGRWLKHDSRIRRHYERRAWAF